MGSTNISVRDETYERLLARKREGESFTELFERLLGESSDITDYRGAASGSDLADRMDEIRDDIDAGVSARCEDVAEAVEEGTEAGGE